MHFIKHRKQLGRSSECLVLLQCRIQPLSVISRFLPLSKHAYDIGYYIRSKPRVTDYRTRLCFYAFKLDLFKEQNRIRNRIKANIDNMFEFHVLKCQRLFCQQPKALETAGHSRRVAKPQAVSLPSLKDSLCFEFLHVKRCLSTSLQTLEHYCLIPCRLYSSVSA